MYEALGGNLGATEAEKKYQGKTNRSKANALVVVESLEDGKVNIGRLVTQEIGATGVPRVEFSEQAMEFVDMRGLVVGRLGG